MTVLAANQMFSANDPREECVRILAVLPGGEKFYYLDLLHGNALPIAASVANFQERIDGGELVPLAIEPDQLRPPLDSRLSEAAKAIRDRRYRLICTLVEENRLSILDPTLRHGLLSATSTDHNVSRSHLYSYLRMWWRRGQLPNAVAPGFDRCGGPGKSRLPGSAKRGRPVETAGTARGVGVNVSEEIAAKLRTGAGALKRGKSWQDAFDEVSLIHFASPVLVDGVRTTLPPDQRPTLGQFKYYLSKVLSPADIERAVKGDAQYERNRAERTGFSRDVPNGPGHIFQIDATIANIFLRARYDPDKLVGKPVLYLVTDQSSGEIVGYTVSLGNASWDVARLALENAFTDKVESCRRAGVEIAEADWPACHVPEQLTGDRGWDILGKQAGVSGFSLGIRIANLPPYRPDLKGLVESKFEWLDVKSVKWAAGATHGRKRGDKDDRPNELDGLYDLDAFRKFMIYAIIRHNTTLRVKKPPTWYPKPVLGMPSPNEIWEYGCIHRGAPKVHPAWLVRANLLPEVRAKVTDYGLKVGRLTYASIDQEERRIFDRASGRKWPTIMVRHDPGNVGRILMPTNNGGFSMYQLVPADRAYDGWSQEEVSVSFALQRAQDSMSERGRMDQERRYKMDVRRLNEAVRADAVLKREALGTAKPARCKVNLTADAGERALERREREAEQAWIPGTRHAGRPPPSSVRPTRQGRANAQVAEAPKKASVAEEPSGKTAKPSKLDVIKAISQPKSGGGR